MKNNFLRILGVLPLYLFILSCQNNREIDTSGISIDSLSIAQGKMLFTQHCSTCHTFRQAGIGPQLGGITHEVSADYITEFIKNPKKVIDSGDKRAKDLFEKFKSYMIPFGHLSDTAISSIISYIHIHDKPLFRSISDTMTPLINPIPDTIERSSFVVDLKLVTQVPATDTSKRLLTRITKLDYESSSKDLFLLDLRGKLYRVLNNRVETYIDISKLMPRFVHKPGLATGFGSFAFHPEFSKNGLLYTTHTEPPGSGLADFKYHDSIKVMLQWVLTEWKTEHPRSSTFTGKPRELMRVNVESPIHGMQEIVFNKTSKKGDEDYGLLYIGIGDGGSVENGFPFLAHDLNKIWGNVLRIDPMVNGNRSIPSLNKMYGIPATNPFVQLKDSGAIGEIYARGFRNPHRITWTNDGKMLVSNVGHFNIESLNYILPGHDYGWPLTEGRFMIDVNGDMKKVYRLPDDYSKYHITYPTAAYDHDEGLAICGGHEYGGTTLKALRDKFIFGDIVKGRLFYIQTNEIAEGRTATIHEGSITLNGEAITLKKLCGCDKVDLHFGKDAYGDLYILTKPDGKLYKIVGAGE